MPPSFPSAPFEMNLDVLNTTVPAELTFSDGAAWTRDVIFSLLSAAWMYFLSFLATSFKTAAQMVEQIVSQMIGTSLIGVIVYRYRDKFKDFISDIVNAAGAAVPEDWIDEEALVDIIEDAAGINTPIGSDEEGEEREKGEDTPLLQKANGVNQANAKTRLQKRNTTSKGRTQ